MGEASTFVAGTRLMSSLRSSIRRLPQAMGFAHTQMGFAHTQMGASPHTPTLRAYARRGGIKLNIIIVHASIQAMRGLRPLKLPLTKDPLKWSIEATWRTQLTNRSAGQNVTDNHSDHHSDKHSMFFFPEANPEATVESPSDN